MRCELAEEMKTKRAIGWMQGRRCTMHAHSGRHDVYRLAGCFVGNVVAIRLGGYAYWTLCALTGIVLRSLMLTIFSWYNAISRPFNQTSTNKQLVKFPIVVVAAV